MTQDCLDDMDKLKTAVQQNKRVNNVNRYSLDINGIPNTTELANQTKLLEKEVKMLKHETFEKNSTIDLMKIQLEEQFKNNKFLGELCENLQHQFKK